MNNYGFLVTAYLIIWGGVFTYLMYMGSQQRRLSRRLRDLETALAEKEAH